jgi:hypothetical protein
MTRPVVIGIALLVTCLPGASLAGSLQMFFCTETSKHSDKPDQYEVWKEKYIIDPGGGPGDPPGYGRYCWSTVCSTQTIEEGKMILDRRNESNYTLEDTMNLMPPYHRAVQTYRNGVTNIAEGPCEVFNQGDRGWADHELEPQRVVERVCLYAGGPSNCTPERFIVPDR